MKVRFTAEIIDDNGNTLKTPVSVETKVPDLTDFNCPSKFLKRKSAYRAKEAKANTFFEDMGSVSKAVKNNSCQIVMPITKRDC